MVHDRTKRSQRKTRIPTNLKSERVLQRIRNLVKSSAESNLVMVLQTSTWEVVQSAKTMQLMFGEKVVLKFVKGESESANPVIEP